MRAGLVCGSAGVRIAASVGLLWLSRAPDAGAEAIVWAKGAAHFGHECAPPATNCTLAQVPSPDRRHVLRVSRAGERFRYEIVTDSARESLHPGSDRGADLEEPYVEMEVLWAPDSTAASLSWNETAITDRTEVYVRKGAVGGRCA